MHHQQLLRELERRFRPGYRLVDIATAGAHIEGPDGKRVTLDGRVLLIAVSDASAHRLRRAESLLRHAGVIDPVRRRSRDDHAPRPLLRTQDTKSVLLLASETLRDPHASPRERRLAREVLDAGERMQRAAALARQLGIRLRETEAALDTHAA